MASVQPNCQQESKTGNRTLRRQTLPQRPPNERRALAALKELRGEVVPTIDSVWLVQRTRQLLGDPAQPPRAVADLAQWEQTRLELQTVVSSIKWRRPAGFGLNSVSDYDLAMPHLQAFSDLESLSLKHPKVHDRHLTYLRGFTKTLRRLRLYHSSVTDDGLSELADFKELTDLDLGYAVVSDRGLIHLKDLNKLQDLSLIATAVTDDRRNRSCADRSMNTISSLSFCSPGSLVGSADIRKRSPE